LRRGGAEGALFVLQIIDGGDLRAFNSASVRSHMAFVEQTPRLFNRTVAENIAYGDNTRELSMMEILMAAKAANIHTFITSLPEVVFDLRFNHASPILISLILMPPI
jgi:ABC-type multidrug transport system fused ATPase/permease subunit